jgi:hypothetical protein
MKTLYILFLLLPGIAFAQTTGTVTTKTVKVPVADKATADSMKAVEYLKEKAVYDDVRKELSFPVNEVGKADVWSWRLVHDGKAVIDFSYSNGTTGTIFELYEGTYNDCRKKISDLALEITDEQDKMAAAQFARIK